MNDGTAEMQELENLSPEEAPTERPEPRPVADNSEGGWSMPQPVFRKSSGYTPQRGQAIAPAWTAAPAPPVQEMDIEPQPDLHEAVPDEPVAAVPVSSPVEEKSGRSAVWAIITLLVIAVFVIAFSVGVYFLFFRSGGDGAF
jgi:uncharacterized membrane protein